MEKEEIVKLFATALLGSSGIIGLFFYYLKKYIDNAIKAAEDSRKARRAEQLQATIDNLEWQDKFSKWCYWVQKGINEFDIEHNYWNGECRDAFEKLNDVEKHIKDHNNKIIAEHKLENH